MCEKAVGTYQLSLLRVPHWFITPKMLELFDNNDLDFYDFYKLFTWHNKYD